MDRSRNNQQQFISAQFPWGWGLLLLFWISIFLGVWAGTYDPSHARSKTLKSVQQFSHQKKSLPAPTRHTLRIHLSGRGKEKEWNPDETQHLDYFQQIVYESRFQKVKNGFRETRSIEKFRIIVVSSIKNQNLQMPEAEQLTPLTDWARKHQLNTFGKEHLPVLKLDPRNMPDRLQNMLLKIFRPSRPNADKNQLRGLVYMSPLEGKSISLTHASTTDIPDIVSSLSIPELEKEMLQKSPVRPLRSLKNHLFTPPNTRHMLLDGKGLSHYVHPIIRSRIEGTISLYPSSKNNLYGKNTGGGTLNLIHPEHNQQIGEIALKHLLINISASKNQIDHVTLSGRIILKKLQKRHFLRRIQFLEAPTFQITYNTHEME